VPALALLSSVALVLLLTPLAVRVAWATGYLDHPEARKLHTSATALLGGVVVFVCALAAWLIARLLTHAPETRTSVAVLGGAVLALGLGMWDDRFGMNPLVKMTGQGIAAGILLVGVGVPGLGLGPIGDLVLSVVVLVALMNAVNFLDNMNGMVAGMSAIILAVFSWTSLARGDVALAAAQLAIAGACLGFLRSNFPRASIFLGDAGSLFLGYSLGASALLTFMHAPQGWGRLGAALMVAYPAFDMCFVVINRLREGRKVYEGGKDHSNHRLASVIQWKRTVILVWCVTAALCASGVVVLSLNQPLPALLLSGLWSILFLVTGLRLSSVPVHRPTPPLAPQLPLASVASPSPKT
jgi:UDP-GlcNAc:undecaprenyl-phosphate/decaprenyl-phosphate GlcNAc-1-phosphate transferase